MTTEISNSDFEQARQLLVGKAAADFEAIVASQFDEEYPPDGLYSGSFSDRVAQFVRIRVKSVCAAAGEAGATVWNALNDEHTAHNIERFALVCGFFAMKVFPGSHWPAHEIAALVLLVITLRHRGDAKH